MTSLDSSPSRPIPDLIPSLRGWTPSDGSFTLTPDVRVVAPGEAAERAGLLAVELGALLESEVPVVDDAPRAGDVALTVDESRREELGAEGYALTVGPTVRVEAATPLGAFYGTRTLAQLLVQQPTLPGGSVVDTPRYAERGVMLCASQINVSTAWIDRLLDEMSHLKLNHLLLELKVRSSRHPQTVTWSYYTPEEIRRLVTRGAALGIEVVPEINSPGHMAVWLENLPELQLRDRDGRADEVRLDITRPEALAFYTSLVDEYLEAFTTTDHWHMGADEYMIDSAFENFPHIAEHARAKFGSDATPQDVFVDFINQVSAHVKEKHGKTLRIWNDGLTGANTIAVDSDIVVEHWQDTPVGPAELIANGHRVMNASYHLYTVRGGLKINTSYLYGRGWHPGQFYGGWTLEPDTPGLTGAKFSMWPDSAAEQTEHEVEDEMFMPLRLMAQATWTGDYVLPTYAQFQAAARKIGRPLTWQGGDRRPVADGDYTVRTAAGQALESEDSRLVLREDGAQHWSLQATDDGYYRVTSGGRSLDVLEGQRRLGVPVEIGVPVVAAEQSASNVQKWQLVEHGDGYELVNASTQQRLAVDPAGDVVQLPPDRTGTRWSLTPAGAPRGTRPARPEGHVPGGAHRLPEPTGTTDEPGTVERWRVSVHDVSSELGKHPAVHTLDGSPQTIWHSGPAATEAPHHITYDLGADYRLASLVYTPRQGPDRAGVLRDYAVHVSRRPQDWGQPAATGTLADTPASSTIDLGGAVGRYVRLVYLGSHGDGTSASAAAVNVTGVPVDADTLQP